MREIKGFGPQIARAMRVNKALNLDFWALFLCYFLLAPKERKKKNLDEQRTEEGLSPTSSPKSKNRKIMKVLVYGFLKTEG